jgi:photosystem I P700 chlorophyll a apoprotein A2
LASSLYPFYTGDWSFYSTILTFLGGLRSDTASLYITDIAHHHLALALLFLWQNTFSSSLYKAPMRLSFVSFGNSSLHLHLSLALLIGAGLVALVATSLTSLAPYPYLSYDYLTTTALNLHHSSIASSLMIGSFAHAGIFLVRDARLSTGFKTKDLIGRILAHKAAIISHLTWVVGFLAFHTLGVYVHNDTVFAFGRGQGALLIEPVFAQIVQEFSGKALYGTPLFVQGVSVNKSFGSLISPEGPGDLLAGHAIALGLHLTTLILLKGSLD